MSRKGDINWFVIILVIALLVAGILLWLLAKQGGQAKAFLDSLFGVAG